MGFKTKAEELAFNHSTICVLNKFDCLSCELGGYGMIDTKVCAMAYAYREALKDAKKGDAHD